MFNGLKKAINKEHSYERKADLEFLRNKFPNLKEGNIINAHIADSDFSTEKTIFKTIIKRAKIRSYSYSYINDASLDAVINWYQKKYNIKMERKDIKLIQGTVNFMHQLIQAKTKEGDGVIIQTPVYEPFGHAIINNNRKVVENKLVYKNNTYEIDFNDFEEKIKNNNVKLFMFCNPHNPGGKNWAKNDLDKIVEICNKYNVILFSDEVHGDLDLKGTFTSLLEYKDKIKDLIIGNSPNKLFNLGGMKGSYIVTYNQKLRKSIDDIFTKNYVTTPNIFVQPILQTAYNDERPSKWLEKFLDRIKDNFAFAKRELEDLNISIFDSDSSYLLWVKFDSKLSTDEFRDLCIKNNFIPNFADNFFGGEPGWVRINIGCPKKELKNIINACKTIFASIT